MGTTDTARELDMMAFNSWPRGKGAASKLRAPATPTRSVLSAAAI